MKKLFFIILIMTLLAGLHEKILAQENIKASMLEEVNNLRRTGCKCGDKTMPPVPELKWNDKLEKSALRHAKDMMENELMGHTGSDGSQPDERITATGYRWSVIGENVAFGYSTVEDALEGWKSSQAHCHNIMDPEFSEIGAAQQGIYWVQDFGRAPMKQDP